MQTTPRALVLAVFALAVPTLALAQPGPKKPPPQPTAAGSSTASSRPPPDLPPPPPPPWQPGVSPAPPEPPAVAEPLPGPAPAGTAAPTAAAPIDAAAAASLERRVAVLEQRLVETRRELAERDRQKLAREDLDKLEWLRRFKVSGFLQPQLVWQWFDANASPNPQSAVQGPSATIGANAVTAKADGTTTNPDFFRIRRARLKTEFAPSEHARFVLEIDPTPTGGPSAGIGTVARNVEAVGVVRWPFAMATTEFAMGIFKVPFGYEVLQSDADRPFIERSWVEQNLFPGEFDTGARAYSSLFDHKVDVQIAVVNGQVQGEKYFAVLPDLNRGKDVVGRIALDLGVATIAASGYYGYGQIVDAQLLRFKQFPRWALNGEIDVRYTFPFMKNVGQTRVFAEVTRGQNMDRGTKYGALALPSFPADVAGGNVNDLDELGYWARLEQDLGSRFTLAVRYDSYTPNSAEANNGRDTFGAVGVVHFTRALQWMLEFDHAVDNVHLPGAQAPSKHIETLSNVLQVRF